VKAIVGKEVEQESISYEDLYMQNKKHWMNIAERDDL